MFNRLITRIKETAETDKGRESPQTPASTSSRPPIATGDQTAEGFLCPTCMQNFALPEDLQTHYENIHSEGERHICPICKNEFPTLDQLQIHYTSDHISSGLNHGDLKTLKQEVAELQTTLKEERWHSDELKREVSRLSGVVSKESEDCVLPRQLRGLEENNSLLTSEVVLLRKQLGEAVEMHTSMKQQKELVEQKAASLAAEKVALQASFDEERGLRSSVENQLAEMQDMKTNLEAQLQQRPEADDVRVLRQELVQVQTLMDRMARERETERDVLEQENRGFRSKVQELQQQLCDREEQLAQGPTAAQLQQLQEASSEKEKKLLALKVGYQERCMENQSNLEKLEQLKLLLNEKEDSFAELTKEVKGFQEVKSALERQVAEMGESSQSAKMHLDLRLQELETALQKKDAELTDRDQLLLSHQENSSTEMLQKSEQLGDLKLHCDGLETSLQEKESKLEDFQKQLSTLQVQYQDQVSAADEIKSRLWEVQAELEKEGRARKAGDEKLQECEAVVQQHKESLQRLEKERNDLYAKIEAGEGADTAIQQLQIEKNNLLEKLAEQQKCSGQQAAESMSKLEELHQTLQETKAQLQSSNEKLSKLQSSFKETSSKLSSTQGKCQQLETSLQSKGEALVASESAWNKQRLELENRLRSAQSALTARVGDVERVDGKLKKLTAELASSVANAQALDSKLAEESRQCLQLVKNVQDLEAELNQAKKLADAKVAACDELQRSVDVGQKQVSELKECLNKKEVEFTEQLKNASNIKASLQQQIEQFEREKFSAENFNKELRSVVTIKCQTLLSVASFLKQEVLDVRKQQALLQHTILAGSQRLKEECWKTSSMFADTQNALSEKSKLADVLRLGLNELEASRQQQEVDLGILRNTTQEQTAKIQGQDECITKLTSELNSKATQLKNVDVQLEKAVKESNQRLSDLHNSESSVALLRKEYDVTVANLENVESALADVHGQCTDATAALQDSLQELEESKKLGEGLKQALDARDRVKAELDERSKELNMQLAVAIDGLNDAILRKTSLETELFDAQKSLSDFEEKCSNLEMTVVDLRNQHVQEKDSLEKQISKLQDAQELLIGQKLEIQNELLAAKEQLKKEVASYDKTCEALKKMVASHQQQLAEEGAQLVALQESKNAVEQEAEQAKARYEMQMGTLQENLATLRADLVSHQDKVQALEKKEGDLLGDKLELEAKLENALDERRALLERCLNSEGECEKLRTSTVELRRKLDDALSALHELGRENQTLQIETAKHVNRKWADDSDAHNCSRCQKLFSVTVRKHHCRNCGNIYCNECSTKNATIAAYKKPVRVCDGCYDELITK